MVWEMMICNKNQENSLICNKIIENINSQFFNERMNSYSREDRYWRDES